MPIGNGFNSIKEKFKSSPQVPFGMVFKLKKNKEDDNIFVYFWHYNINYINIFIFLRKRRTLLYLNLYVNLTKYTTRHIFLDTLYLMKGYR